MKRELGYDPLTGIRETWIEADGKIIIQSSMDAEPAIRAAKAMKDAFPGRHGDMSLVALIPANIWFDQYRKGRFRDKTDIKRWLNDPDNAYFRTSPGAV